MIKMLLKYKWYLAVIVVFMILEPTINSVLNFWLQNLFNSASAGADKLYILRLLTVGFLLWISKRIVSYIMLVVRDRYICNAKQDVKHKMFSGLLLKNTSNISGEASSGEYISMFTNDIMLLEQRFFNQVMALISGVFSIVILGYSFIALNFKLALAIIGFGLVTSIVPIVFSRNLNEKNMIYSGKMSAFTQKLKEFVIAYPTIKNYSIENMISDKFDGVNEDTENAKFEADCAISLANNVGQLLAWFMQFIGVGLGLMLVVKGEIMIGTVIAAQSFASDLALPIQNIIVNINSMRSIKNIVDKLAKLYESNNAAAHTEFSEELPLADKHELCFDNVSLCLDGNTIVDGFSYNFEHGKKYLIVGMNGSGKSSVFKMLKKWYTFSSGEIKINDRNISEFSNEELSRIVSYLNENVSLFSGSVEENISLFRTCESEMLNKAVEQAHIELNLNREIVDEGRNVSSGEQRRIEIARSLLKSASIMIFDEITSTLDIETAYEIEKSAMELDDKTVIFISHNFSGKLIKTYDNIIIMDEGKIVAAGSYDELLESSEYFRRICNIKFGSEVR